MSRATLTCRSRREEAFPRLWNHRLPPGMSTFPSQVPLTPVTADSDREPMSLLSRLHPKRRGQNTSVYIKTHSHSARLRESSPHPRSSAAPLEISDQRSEIRNEAAFPSHLPAITNSNLQPLFPAPLRRQVTTSLPPRMLTFSLQAPLTAVTANSDHLKHLKHLKPKSRFMPRVDSTHPSHPISNMADRVYRSQNPYCTAVFCTVPPNRNIPQRSRGHSISQHLRHSVPEIHFHAEHWLEGSGKLATLFGDRQTRRQWLIGARVRMEAVKT